MSNLVFKDFDGGDTNKVLVWFDDPNTKKWLGGKDWVENVLRLKAEPIGTEFRGSRKLDYYAFLVFDQEEPVGLIDAGISDSYVKYSKNSSGSPFYSDREEVVCAGISFVVNPKKRGKGYASRIIREIIDHPKLKDVGLFTAGVKPENTASIKSLEDAGFKSDYKKDFEGMYYFFLRR